MSGSRILCVLKVADRDAIVAIDGNVDRQSRRDYFARNLVNRGGFALERFFARHKFVPSKRINLECAQP